jgi:hypothetical protein
MLNLRHESSNLGLRLQRFDDGLQSRMSVPMGMAAAHWPIDAPGASRRERACSTMSDLPTSGSLVLALTVTSPPAGSLVLALTLMSPPAGSLALALTRHEWSDECGSEDQ